MTDLHKVANRLVTCTWKHTETNRRGGCRPLELVWTVPDTLIRGPPTREFELVTVSMCPLDWYPYAC